MPEAYYQPALALAQYNQRLRGERGVNLEIRIGVNTGDVVLRAIRTDDLHTDYVPMRTLR